MKMIKLRKTFATLTVAALTAAASAATVAGAAVMTAPSAQAHEAVEQTQAERRAARQAKKAKREANLRRRIREARQTAAARKILIKSLGQRHASWTGTSSSPTITYTNEWYESSWMRPPNTLPAAAKIRSVAWGVTLGHEPKHRDLTMRLGLQTGAQAQEDSDRSYSLSGYSGQLSAVGTQINLGGPFRFTFAVDYSGRSIGDWGTKIPLATFTSGNIAGGAHTLRVAYQY